MPKQPTSSPLSFTVTADPQAISTLLDRIQSIVEETLLRCVAKLIPPAEHPPAQKAIADHPPEPDLKKTVGVQLSKEDKVRAADLRTALLLGKVPEGAGLLVSTKEMVKLLNVSPRTLWRITNIKAIPQPVRIGTLMRWRLDEILAWLEADCPPDEQWQRMDRTRKK